MGQMKTLASYEIDKLYETLAFKIYIENEDGSDKRVIGWAWYRDNTDKRGDIGFTSIDCGLISCAKDLEHAMVELLKYARRVGL